MPEKILTTEPPELELDDFEEYLATDDLFVNYFNEFLELPSFPEPLRFNTESGSFEILTPAKYELADKIKTYARSRTPISCVYRNATPNAPIKLPHYEKEKLEKELENPQEDLKTSFNVKYLDKEQGITWIKQNRFPDFLQSEMYMEYRLAKLLSQIETSKGGIKLTINREFKPWQKIKKEVRLPTPVDPTEEMIKKLNVTMGSSTSEQTKQWYTIAKQVESPVMTPSNPSRLSQPLLRRRTSSSRPISVESARNDVGDDADSYLGGQNLMEMVEEISPKSQPSVVFSPTTSSGFPIHSRQAARVAREARVVPIHMNDTTRVSHVITVEPEEWEEESGVGSDCDVNNAQEQEEKEKKRAYLFSVTDLESFASLKVAMVIKDAFQSLATNLDPKTVDRVVNLEPIMTLSPRGSLLSDLDNKIFSDALLDHESKRLERREENSGDQTKRKSITFKTKADDEADSVFSEESDQLEADTSPRNYAFNDSRSFEKFRSFLLTTVGAKLLDLWLDIDKSRFGSKVESTSKYLQRMRGTYVKVGSTKRLPNEVLSKYKLLHATQWTLEHLKVVQREIAEPLLVYWAPRFLVRTPHAVAPEASDVTMIRSRVIRPMSSQSYPSPKTITIVPLRPKSCLPRIKHDVIKPDRGHVMSDYHRYVNRDVLMTSLDPSPPLTSPSPIPGYLLPKVEALERGDRLPRHRPSTAGPLTRKVVARIERRKSAKPRKSAPPTVRPTRIVTSPRSSVTSEGTLRGSPPMESMLQALLYDTRAGWFFTRFCENSNNKLWSSSVHFWFGVQDFRRSFYSDISDHFSIRKKAQTIYSSYIVDGSSEDIGVSKATKSSIRSSLDPPFEDLFDDAEEYSLKMLIVPWNQMLGIDRESYGKIQQIDHERSVNVASKYSKFLQRKGILKEKRPIATDEESVARYEEDLWMKVPEDFRSFSFDDLLRNRIELEFFRKFLDEHFAKTDLVCWLDIESFKRIPHQAAGKSDEKAKEIKQKYLHKKYFFGRSSPATKDQQNQAVLAGGGWGKTLKERPTSELLMEVQKLVRSRIDRRWLPLFLATEAYQERQRPRSQMSEVAEDVVLQKKKKRGEPWKLMLNRWQSSSRELMEFRRSLSNPVTAGQFRRYVSLKGELLENDVLFWIEVQKYKDLCHIHNESSSVDAKVVSIVDCFIHSQVPPSLQIDIPVEMADKLLEKRKELGPYVFREAQMTVFQVLFPYWSQFCEFRKTLGDEKLTTSLDRQRKRRREKMRSKMKEQHEEAIREEARLAKEARSPHDELHDILSTGGSEGADDQVTWSYGRYVEQLEQERLLLLMENEVKGRVPPEPLPDRDPDVSTVSSDAGSDVDDRRSRSSDDVSVTSQGFRKKKSKDKIIISKFEKKADQSEATKESRGREPTNQRPGFKPDSKAAKVETKSAVTVD